ncbi:hypothetical protein ACN47E_000703 [Coniothyrium glycines]
MSRVIDSSQVPDIIQINDDEGQLLKTEGLHFRPLSVRHVEEHSEIDASLWQSCHATQRPQHTVDNDETVEWQGQQPADEFQWYRLPAT